jgi:hypothetical protein
MTCFLPNTSNSYLHAHYNALCELEKAADARADESPEAERAWEKAWDEKDAAEDAILEMPVESIDHDVRVKVGIIAQRSAMFDDDGNMIARLRDQLDKCQQRLF